MIKKIRLLQINSTLNWGSTGRIAEDIGLALMTEGGESYIAYGRNANVTKSNAIQIGTKRDIYNHVLQTRLLDRHGLASKKATKKLIKEIIKINPDIIHLHNIHGYYLNYPILFEYLSSIQTPIVWTLHDCWTFTGHCAYYSFHNCNKWKKGCHKCPQIRRYPSSWGVDMSERNFFKKNVLFTSVKNLTLIAVSDWLSNEVKYSFFKKFPIKTIHNGIDIDTFKPSIKTKEDLNLFSKFTILGVASIWEKRKGLDDFYALNNKLDKEFQIILIGLTEKQIKELPEGIIGIQRTNSIQELATYYSIADVFFNPTWEDNFPTTNLEALACGTPVITYRTGGSPEAIDKDTGYSIEQGDLDTAIKAIYTIKECGKIKYSNLCRKRAIDYFNKKERYAEYLQLYKELLNKL